jgi:DNA-binding NarL/FixJ family response regulator
MATRVLIVDDHPSFRATARVLLESEGFEIVGEAEDGRSALAAVVLLQPDVVLLDVQLPDFDGFEVAKRLAVAMNGTTPAIVLMSSRDGADYGSAIAECCALGFVAKGELSAEALSALLG